jgi:DNA-binding MarR family transcriptional regulator
VPAPTPGCGQFALGQLEHLLVFRFRRLRDFILDRFRASTAATGRLKAGDLMILGIIDANPSISQTDLSRISGCDPAVLVGILDGLEDRGLAVRKRDKADRRRHKLQITAEGREALKELCDFAAEAEAVARAGLTAEENAVLDRALTKMYQHVYSAGDGRA